MIRVITRLLSAAVKFYLRSQVERVEDLQVKITGKNRQILQGYIPQVFLACQQGVYQGLHLREVELNGANIAINLAEVRKKQPLRLLEPIVVDLKLSLNANDLIASLDSALLQSGLSDLWQIILAASPTTYIDKRSQDTAIKWDRIAIADNKLELAGTYQNSTSKDNHLQVSTEISLSNNHTLCLFPLTIHDGMETINESTEKVEIDLGCDVAIEQLTIESTQILCLGKITINN